MLIERVIGGKVVQMFTGDKREMFFLLDDGSKMKVSTCEACLRQYEESNKADKVKIEKDIMECVYKGWEYETQLLVNSESKPFWTHEKRKKYLDRYKKLKILEKLKDIDQESVKRRHKKHLAKSKK